MSSGACDIGGDGIRAGREMPLVNRKVLLYKRVRHNQVQCTVGPAIARCRCVTIRKVLIHNDSNCRKLAFRKLTLSLQVNHNPGRIYFRQVGIKWSGVVRRIASPQCRGQSISAVTDKG